MVQLLIGVLRVEVSPDGSIEIDIGGPWAKRYAYSTTSSSEPRVPEILERIVSPSHLLLPRGRVGIEVGGLDKAITELSTARLYKANLLLYLPVYWSISSSGRATDIRFQYVWASCDE